MLRDVVNCLYETSVKNFYESTLLLKTRCWLKVAAEVEAWIFYANWEPFHKCVQSSYIHP